MKAAERKRKFKDALNYLGNAQEGIDRNLQPVSKVSNNFYEELVEHFAFVVAELNNRDEALRNSARMMEEAADILGRYGAPRFHILKSALEIECKNSREVLGE